MSCYYIEILDNLHVVDIYAKSSDGNDVIRLDTNRRVFVDECTSVDLPVSVEVRLAAKSLLADPESQPNGPKWIRIRVPISRSSKEARLETASQLVTNIPRPVTASAVKKLRGICCKECGKQLLDESARTSTSSLSTRDLPSAYWGELVDCWVCHPEEDNLTVNTDLLHFFEPSKSTDDQKHIESDQGSQTLTSQVDVWIGDVFMLVSSGMFEKLPTRLVNINAKERFHNAYTELVCDKCGFVVGEAGRMGSRRMNRLFLHRIQIETVSDSSTLSLAVDLSQVLCSEMLGHVGAHAVYKFVVEGRRSCMPQVLIHVVGWNTELHASKHLDTIVENCEPSVAEKITRADDSSSTSKSTLAVTSTTTMEITTRTCLTSYSEPFARYVKVLFLTAEDSRFESMAKDWLAGDSAELISLLDEDCCEIIKDLNNSFDLIPPQIRSMANMKRGFLRL